MNGVKKDFIKIMVNHSEAEEIINKYKNEGYVLYSIVPNIDFDDIYFCKYVKEEDKQTEEDKVIGATKKANVTKDDLLDVFWDKGLVGVYNLGLKNMLDYLNGK